MTESLFHASRQPDAIERFLPLSHFGTMAAAQARARGVSFDGRKATLYEVVLDVSNPLQVPDLLETNHSWLKFTDQLHYDCGAISSEDRDKIFRAAAPSGQNTEAGIAALVAMLQSKGYDSLRYRNMHEDHGSMSWVILDPETVKVLSVDGEPVPEVTAITP